MKVHYYTKMNDNKINEWKNENYENVQYIQMLSFF